MPQVSDLWPIVFLKQINNLLLNLEANIKLFVDDTSMLSVVREPTTTSQKLNKDLDKVGLRANKWKMSFNLDSLKQAQEVISFTEDNQSISIIDSKTFGDIS